MTPQVLQIDSHNQQNTERKRMNNFKETANFIWDIANLLRGDYKQSDYGKIILPFTVIRRLDCVLAPTKEKVLNKLPKVKGTNVQNIDPILNKVAGHGFHNRSNYDFDKLIADSNNVAANLRNYINGFSENAREIIEYFDFDKQIDRLEKSNLLYLIVKKFQEIDLHPSVVSNLQAGYMFEELIRKFAELSNETAGEHFTPREVIRLMVNILFIADKDILTKSGIVKTIYDPAGGTGGMLSVSDEYVRELNKDARLELFGQEINPESYGIFKADMLIKGQNASNVKFGNSFTEDGLEGEQFDYMLSNPPFGVSWKKTQEEIKKEHEGLGFSGRFGAGLPRVSDGSLLFLQHMMAKMKKGGQGTRLAIVFNGSPLFTGGAGSGESEIRRWVIENDYLETIIALPDQLFYNTGISTYIWVVDNKKRSERKGTVQLINAVSMYEKMSKSLGNKRHKISDEQIKTLTQIYGEYQEGKFCKVFDNEDFGYHRVTVERPLRDDKGDIVKDKKGNPKPDTSLRDHENIPLKQDVQDYFEKEVLTHVPDAWIDHSKTKVGYEVNFTRYFYEYTPLRPTKEIRAEILNLKEAMSGLTLKAIN